MRIDLVGVDLVRIDLVAPNQSCMTLKMAALSPGLRRGPGDNTTAPVDNS